MVRADHFSFGGRRLRSSTTNCPVFDARRHTLRRPFLYGTRVDRATVRYHSRAAAGDVSRSCATTRPWLVALFHLAPFQAHAWFCHCATREVSRRKEISQHLGPSRILER